MASRIKNNAAKKNRILGLLLFICGLIIAVSLLTHSQANDTSLLIDSYTNGGLGQLFSSPLHNKGGVIGVIIAYALLAIFGYLALLLPLGIWFLSYGYFFSRKLGPILRKIGFAAVFFYIVGLLFSLGAADQAFITSNPGLGGALGHYGAMALKVLTGTVLSYTIVISLLLGGLIWVLPQDLGIRNWKITGLFISAKQAITRMKEKKKRKKGIEKEPAPSEPGVLKRIIRLKRPKKKPKTFTTESLAAGFKAKSDAELEPDLFPPEPEKQPDSSTIKAKASKDGFSFPGIDLLNNPPEDEPIISQQELESTAEVLKETLAS